MILFGASQKIINSGGKEYEKTKIYRTNWWKIKENVDDDEKKERTKD